MSVPAIQISPLQSSGAKLQVVKPEAKEVKEPMSNGKKAAIAITSVCVSAAAIAAIALAAKKGKADKVAEALPQDFVLGENRIKTLIGKKNLKAMSEQIAEVTKRTSDQGVAERVADLAEAFGAEVQHVAQDPAKWVR